MIGTLARLALFLGAAASATQTAGRGDTDQKPPKATVEISTKGYTYRAGQPIRFRAMLANSGTVPFYISKWFGEAGGGISGFYSEATQLTGKKPTINCGIAGDRFPHEKRTPEQVLAEDYLLLFPGQVVGGELRAERYCKEGPYRGRYRITVFYSAQDLNTSNVAAIPGLEYPVFRGQTEKESVIIEVK